MWKLREIGETVLFSRGVAVVLGALVALFVSACQPAPADQQGMTEGAPRAATSASSTSPDTVGDAVATAVSPTDIAPVVPLAGAPASFAALVEQVTPAVVNVFSTQVQTVRAERARPYFGPPSYAPPMARQAQSLGTGFIVDTDGNILTNSHVIQGATSIRVVLHDGRELDASIVGVDPATDIALIRVEPFEGMRPIPLGDSDFARVGDWVVAVGNPFGLHSTVTAGILSARGRRDVPLGGSIRYVDFLQTDASINPGNSGGPLVDMTGHVIGINTAINAEGQGIGFAIPSNQAREVLDQLRDRGRVSRSWLGVYIGDLDDATATALGMPSSRGALVRRIVRGGPADLAGLKPGDVILQFGETEVATGDDLMWIAQAAGVGSRVPVQVQRGRERQAFEVVLGELPE